MLYLKYWIEECSLCSGKTVEEVWQAIQAGKAGERGSVEPVTLGNFLQSVGVDMPSAVSSDFNLASLGHLHEDAKVCCLLVAQYSDRGENLPAPHEPLLT